MEYFLGILFIAIVIAMIYVGFVKLKKRSVANQHYEKYSVGENPKALTSYDIVTQSSNDIFISIEQLSLAMIPSNNQLVEITDKSVIARISETFPHVAETAAKTIKNNNLAKMDVYKVIIPSGKQLAKSKDMSEAVRAFYRNTKGVEGHANLIKIDPSKLSKSGMVANGIANVMNVGSLVVGQYYMAEIDSKLEVISQYISKVSDFQEREFKSRILSLIAHVRLISKFSSEIIENDELRKRKLQTLENLERDASQLLQQVNLSIEELIKRNQNLTYIEYQRIVDEFNVQVYYQQALISVMEEISKLVYFLGKREVSIDMSFSTFNLYLEQSNKVRKALLDWHNNHIETLSIDVSRNRIRKSGLEGVLAEVPAVMDKKWKYKELQAGLTQKISAQTISNKILYEKHNDIYNQDLQIVIKEGKYYYLKNIQNS